MSPCQNDKKRRGSDSLIRKHGAKYQKVIADTGKNYESNERSDACMKDVSRITDIDHAASPSLPCFTRVELPQRNGQQLHTD